MNHNQAEIAYSQGRICVAIANQFKAKLCGLLVGQPRAIWLFNTRSIHTIGMRYHIDIWYLDWSYKVVRCVEGLAPYRLSSDYRATSVIELPTGVVLPPMEGETLDVFVDILG